MKKEPGDKNKIKQEVSILAAISLKVVDRLFHFQCDTKNKVKGSLYRGFLYAEIVKLNFSSPCKCYGSSRNITSRNIASHITQIN